MVSWFCLVLTAIRCYIIKEFGGSQYIGASCNVKNISRNTVGSPKDEICRKRNDIFVKIGFSVMTKSFVIHFVLSQITSLFQCCSEFSALKSVTGWKV